MCATVGIICLFVVLPVNAFQNLPFMIDVGVFILGLLGFYCYWASLKGRNHTVPFFFVLLAVLNPIWFLNAGSDGSITLYFLSAVLYPIALFRGRLRWGLSALLLANLIGLMFLEHLVPSLVTPFGNRHDRLLDVLTGIVCSFLVLAAIAWVIVTTFDREQQRLRAAARKLAASERNYREIFNATNEAIFMHEETTGRMLDVNDAMLRLYGYSSKEEVLAASIGELSAGSAPYTQQHAQRNIELAIEKGPQVFEWLARRKNGDLFWTEVSLRSSQIGDHRCILAVVRDTNERKLAEVALRESEEQYRRLYENSLVGIYRTTPEGRILLANAALVSMLRYRSFEELAKLDLEKDGFFSSFPRHLFKELIERDGIVRGVESVWTCANGSTVNVLENAHAVFGTDGRILYYDGVVEDITERKKAEKALQESEERFRQISMASSDFVYSCVHDEESDYALDWLAGAVERITGCSAAELMARRCWSFLVVEEDLPKFHLHVTGLRSGETGSCELRLRRADGSIIWVASYARCVGDLSRTSQVRLRGALKDISDRKRSEEERERLQAQLIQAQKMESVGRLAGGVAHDFNNMLTAIQVNATMAMQTLPAGHLLRDKLEEIQHCAQRSADLTQQLLAFARKQTIAPKVVDLNETVEGMLKMLRRLIGEDIDLVWRPASELWSIKIDPSQIDQILANLCLNSRDAIAGVGKIVLETGNLVADEAFCAAHAGITLGNYVQLTACDTGCGMDKTIMGHIFEPFFTTKEVGQGTGLGLATVYGIVKQNNGFIEVVSEPGQGTTFRIYLPRHAGKATTARKLEPLQVPVPGHETILLVEDEVTILKIAAKALEGLGYTVISASSPEEAILLAERYSDRIQLLMTDVIMPGMNGRDLVDKLQSFYPNLKVLFMSGYTANVIAPHGVLDEGMYFIEKPFSVEELSDMVRKVLDARKSGS